uniref:Virulence associated protein n=1 Tax=Desulfococcus multivorans TaxID=897 RepID=Q2N519_DESML|nr:virulence associated protein [Desulfococcus multivorans]
MTKRVTNFAEFGHPQSDQAETQDESQGL